MRRRWNQRMRKKRKTMRSRQTGVTENDGETAPRCFFVALESFARRPRRPHPTLSKSWDSHWGTPDCTRLVGPRDLPTGGLFLAVRRALVQSLSGSQHHVCLRPFSCHPWSTRQSGHTPLALPLTADSSPLFLRHYQVEAEPCCSLSWGRSLLRDLALPGTASCRARSVASCFQLSLVWCPLMSWKMTEHPGGPWWPQW